MFIPRTSSTALEPSILDLRGEFSPANSNAKPPSPSRSYLYCFLHPSGEMDVRWRKNMDYQAWLWALKPPI